MKPTSIWQKLFASIVNVLIVFLFSPILLAHTDKVIGKKFVIIALFFLYSMFFQIFSKNKDIGMLVAESRWKENYPFKNQLIYNVLYTLSFATLFFHVFFVFDIFLVNMLLLQLPCVLITGTTLHGYLAGKMVTVRD